MLSWYTNLLSAIVLIPVFILVGEAPGIMKLLVGEFTGVDGTTSPLKIFLWGSLITVCFLSFSQVWVADLLRTGLSGIPDVHRQSFIY